MKTLIYQNYRGPLNKKVLSSIESFKKYATYTNSEYRFDHYPEFISQEPWYSTWYNTLTPIVDESFQEYDKVLYIDTDMYVNYDNLLLPNIFDEEVDDIAMARHVLPSEAITGPLNNFLLYYKKRSNEIWQDIIYKNYLVELQMDNLQMEPVYFSSGAVLYTGKGLNNLNKSLIDFDEYTGLIMKDIHLDYHFSLPERYLLTLASVSGTFIKELSINWNYQVVNRNLNDLKLRFLINNPLFLNFQGEYFTNSPVSFINCNGNYLRSREQNFFLHKRDVDWRRMFDN